jgi:hypothetical protein
MDKYEWQNSHVFGSNELFAAIGSVITLWSHCEGGAKMLLFTLMRQPKDLAFKLHSILGNSSRVEVIKHIIEELVDQSLKETIQEFLIHYQICLDNRNVIAHSILIPDYQSPDYMGHVLQKNKKGSIDMMNTFAVNEEQVLGVANECFHTWKFSGAIAAYLIDRYRDSPLLPESMFFPFPQTPPRPVKLVPRTR